MKPVISFDDIQIGNKEIILHLKRYCIETTARQVRYRLVDRLLSDKDDEPALHDVVELLDGFLVGSDFSRIRSEDQMLAGGHSCRIRIFRDSNDQVKWEKL